MTSIRTHKWTRYISALLVLTFVAVLYPTSVSAADVADPPAKVLLFPVSDNSGSDVRALGRMASGILQLAIDGVAGLECTDFSPTSAIVRRARNEGRILPVQVEAGTSDPMQAVRIGHALLMDKVIIAQVESIRTSNSPRLVETVLSGCMYDVRDNYDVEADEPVASPVVERAFGVVGASRTRANYKGSERLLVREALQDGAYKVSQILSGKSVAEIDAARAKPERKKSAWRGLGWLLGVGLLVALVAGTGGDGGGPSPAAAPPIPDRVEVEANAIRLYWTPPSGTSLTLLRYHIERSRNSQPWQRIDGGAADAGRTSWPDFDVETSNTYQYRIRALYTNSAYSEWRVFTAVVFNPT